MFPVLDSNLYPMRSNIWAFLELTVLSELYFFPKNRLRIKSGRKQSDFASEVAKSLTEKEKELSDDFSTTSVPICGKGGEKLAIICVMSAVLTVWRAEAIYYLVLIPLALLFICGRSGKMKEDDADENRRKSSLDKETDDIKTSGIKKYLLCYLLCFIVLFLPQKIGERITSGVQYELTSMVLPLTELVAVANENAAPEDLELLSQIDRVVNVEVTVEGVKEGKNGINLFWGEEDYQRDYDTEDFAACKKAYRKLILRYPDVFLKERWKTFTESHDLLMDTTKLEDTAASPNHASFASYPLSKPFSGELRNKVISILECRSFSDYQDKMPWADAVYSAYLPIFVTLLGFFLALFRKEWMGALVTGAAVCKVPLIFLTAPSRLFLYYYPVYLFGYFLLFYYVFRLTSRLKGEKK